MLVHVVGMANEAILWFNLVSIGFLVRGDVYE